MTRGREFSIEHAEDLFRTSNSIGADVRQRIRHAQNRTFHGCRTLVAAIAMPPAGIWIARQNGMARTRNDTAAVIGEFFIDEIFSGFTAMPKLGEECFARKFQREVGGGAATTACGLAKLGVKVSVFGFVGRSDGDWVVDRLKSCGVDCSGLEFHPTEPTGITVSASTREDRAFFSYYGANEPLEHLIQRPAMAATLATYRHVHFACAPDAETSGKLFSGLSRKARLSIDVQSHVSWLTRPDSLNILRHCTMFFPNEREGSWISAALEPHDILLRLRDKARSN